MFNSVEYVRELCKTMGISVSKLEKDCGFSNGYLNPKKMSKLPYDRAVIIAKYLGVSENLILTGIKTEGSQAASRIYRDAKDVLDDVDIAFYGDFKKLDEEQQATVRDMVRIMRERRSKRE